MSAAVLLILRVLMALGLYTFLAWVMFVLWKELRLHGRLIASRKIPVISLSILTDGSPSQTCHFDRSELVIGRDPACDYVIEDEAVSGQHARLSFHHGQWWLEDLKSTNGTKLNDQPLTMPTVITSDDEITCGQTKMVIVLAETARIPPDQPQDDQDPHGE